MKQHEVIDLIKKDIADDLLQEANNKIYRLISELEEDYKNDIYHEYLYLLGIINTKEFEKTGLNRFSQVAYEYFATANNYYLAFHNENSNTYLSALKCNQQNYRHKNTKITNP